MEVTVVYSTPSYLEIMRRLERRKEIVVLVIRMDQSAMNRQLSLILYGEAGQTFEHDSSSP